MNYARICLTVYLNVSHVCASIVSHLLRDSGQITVVTHTDLIDRNYEPRYSQTSQYPRAEMCYVNNTVTYESATHFLKNGSKIPGTTRWVGDATVCSKLGVFRLFQDVGNCFYLVIQTWIFSIQFLLKTQLLKLVLHPVASLDFFLIDESTFHIKAVIMPAADSHWSEWNTVMIA